MYKYSCSYCEDPLCPEICPKAVVAYEKFIAERNEKRKYGEEGVMEDTKIVIQNFLNFVCFETQGKGGTSGNLEKMLETYLTETEE